MARSLSSAKFLSALVLDSLSFSRRGYAAAASQGATSARSSGASRMGKVLKKEEAAENAWVPDPVTGYYRPANRANEIDVAELREILINQRIRSQ